MGDLKFQLQHYISELWKRRWSILVVVWLVGLLGMMFAASQPDTFTSRARVFVDTRSLIKRIVGNDLPIPDPSAEIDNVRKFMYARPNVEEVIRRTDLDLTLNDQRDWETLVESITEKMNLKRQGRDFYLIEFENGDPTRARDVVQTLLDIFLEQGLVRSSVTGEGSEVTRRYVEGQLEIAQGQLTTVEEQLAKYERDYRAELAGGASVSSEKRGLESQLSQLQSDRLLYEQEISSLRSRLAAAPAQVIERYVTPPQPQRQFVPPPSREKLPIPQGPTLEEQRYQSFAAQASGVEAEVQQLLRRYTAQHPDVIAAEQRAAAVRAEVAQYRAAAERANAELQSRVAQALQINAQIDEEYRQWQIANNAPLPTVEPRPVYAPNPAIPDLRTQIDQRQSRLTVTEARIRDVRSEISALQGTLSRQPEILQAYERLQSERAKHAAKVEKFSTDLKQIVDFGGAERPSLVDFRVIEPPKVPVKPTGPNRLLLFAAAAIMAFGSALGLAFLRVQLADNMPTLAHLKRSFDLPILGSVSMIETTGQTTRAIASSVVFLAGMAAFVALFAFVTYRYHFELWRPDLANVLGGATGMLGAMKSTLMGLL